MMNDERRKVNQIKELNGDTSGFKPPFPVGTKPEKYWFTTSSVAAGICFDCNKPRCSSCNGCFTDMFETDLESAHCQRCICSPYEEREPLNNTGVPLEELVRKRQGHVKNKRSKK
jgi:hypothetical protein